MSNNCSNSALLKKQLCCVSYYKMPTTEEAELVNEEVNCVSREEVKHALIGMNKSKAVGPDELPVEVWKCMERLG